MTPSLTKGYWKRISPSNASEFEYMEIIPSQYRILTSAIIGNRSKRYAPICVSYQDVCKGEINSRTGASRKWKSHKYMINDKQISFMHDDGNYYHWDRINSSDLPEWWQQFKLRSLANMDIRENLSNSDETNKNG